MELFRGYKGLDRGCIDYDERERDASVETDAHIAAAALAQARDRFEDFDPDACEAEVSVRELVHYRGESSIAASTLDRELMDLITHSIHHLAIIAMIARSTSFPVPRDLGKAPSTIAAG